MRLGFGAGGRRVATRLACVAALLACVAPLAVAQSPRVSPRGDVNLSGTLSAVDAQAVLAHVVGLRLPDDFSALPWGDANCTSGVQAVDAQLILAYVVGISTEGMCVGQPLARVVRVALTPAEPRLVPGSNLPLTLVLYDSADVPLGGRVVDWRSSDTTRVRVSNAGIITGVGLGPATVRVTSERISTSRDVSVGTQLPIGSLAVVIGDSIVYFAGGTWNPLIQVRDQAGRPLPNADVMLEVTAGEGGLVVSNALQPTVTLTSDAQGYVNPQWRFGPQTNTLNALRASAEGAAPVTMVAQTVRNFEGRTQCEIANAGALYCWGGNTAGQVGDGTLMDRLSPVLVAPGTSFKALPKSLRADHTCAIATDDRLFCWGDNDEGQLGDGTRTDRGTPVPIGDALRFKSVSLGFHHSCAIDTSDDLYCWGSNVIGALGRPHENDDGALLPHLVSSTIKFKEVSAGGWHTCGIATTGEAYCWGNNNEGQLGDGTLLPRNAPTRIAGAITFATLGAGERHSCGVSTAGAAFCWGANFGTGQIGDGTTFWRQEPTAVSGGPAFVEIGGAALTTCARTAGGEVWCWGSNSVGTIADGTFTNRFVPTRAASGLVATSLMVGRSTVCARAASKVPYCWGNGARGALGDGTTLSRPYASAVLWVEGTPGQLANLTVLPSTNFQNAIAGTAVAVAPVVVARDFAGAPVSGVDVTFAVTGGGGSIVTTLATTGADGVASPGTWTLGPTAGQLNTLSATTPGVPLVVVSGNSSVAPATIAVNDGDNQLQTVTIPALRIPASVIVRDGSGNPAPFVNVTFQVTGGGGTINSGTTATVATGSTGTASVSWTLGAAVATNTVTATVAGLPPVTFTSQGTAPLTLAHSCELTSAGAAYCWGANGRGQVGDGTNTNRSGPVAVSGGHTFASLAKGMHGDFSCGIIASGAAYCWGSNDFGQLGIGTYASSTTPVPVVGGLAFSKLAVGTMHACGITTSGLVYCWGSNSAGQIGDGTRGNVRQTPTIVPGFGAVDVAVNDLHSCAIAPDNRAFCWGANVSGQLGTGAFTDRLVPTAVVGGFTFSAITAGSAHTCGISIADSRARCWGANSFGELGNGTPGVFTTGANSATPVAVSGGLRLPRPGLTNPTIEPLVLVAISAGRSHTCGITTGSEAWCWGRDNVGQTGKGTFGTARLEPGRPTLGRYASLRAGANHTCAKVAQLLLPYCWGTNASGALGDFSSATSRSTPLGVGSWPQGTAGVPARIVINGGDGQSAGDGVDVAIPPSVVVRDYAGNPVAGVTVTFEVTTRGAGCTETNCSNFAGSVSPSPVVTNAAGIATANWTLGPSTVSQGFNFMDAIIAGSVPAATFQARALAPPASIAINAGDNVVVPQDLGGISTLISVVVRDSRGDPMANVPVTFAADPGQGTFSAQPVLTSTAGTAFTSWFLGRQGASQARASAPGLAPVTFNATAAPSSVGSHACAVNPADNSVQCWGSNQFNQLGNGTATNAYAPAPTSNVGVSFVSVAQGPNGNHSCALTDTGAAYCWGANDFGQLGDNSTTRRSAPVAVLGGHTFSQLAAGDYATCGVRTSDAAILCWGWSGGSVIPGPIRAVTQPALIPGGFTFTQVAVGRAHACGLTTGGQVRCWGTNGSGQLGDATFTNRTTPTLISSGLTFTSVAAGDVHTCAIATNGSAHCWGNNSNGQIGNNFGPGSSFNVPQAVSGAIVFSTALSTAIAAGPSNTCALRASDSTAYCWGNGNQVGDSAFTQRLLPVRVASAVKFKSIFLGRGHSCAIAAANDVPYCWGQNFDGQLGDGTSAARAYPRAVLWPQAIAGTAATVVVHVGNGQSAPVSAALATNPAVRVLDANGIPVSGASVTFNVTATGDQLNGAGNQAIVSTSAAGIAEVAWTMGSSPGGRSMTVAVSGTPGATFSATATAAAAASLTKVSGDNQTVPAYHRFGQALVVEVRDGSDAPMSGVSVRYRRVGADGRAFEAVATTGGDGRAWNPNDFNDAGGVGVHTVTATVAGLTPVTFTGEVRREARGAHACDISVSLQQAMCWGSGPAGEIGNGGTNWQSVPTRVAGAVSFKAMASGMQGDFSCAIAANDRAYCWGANDFGQLGDGTTTSSSTPVPVSGDRSYSMLTTGRFHACGLTTTGTVYCWGWNGYGQIGVGDAVDRLVPTAVSGGATYTSIGSGWWHTCAVRSGATDCWGTNYWGQLGTNNTDAPGVPTPVLTGQQFTSVTGGQGHTCGITAAGAAYCWGGNWSGQLGDSTTVWKLVPTLVNGAHTFTSIGAGYDHTCGIIASTGVVRCWGGNALGQLGDGTLSARLTPTPAFGAFTATALRVGHDWTCARSNSIPYCWGNNPAGQLGRGFFGGPIPTPGPTGWQYPNLIGGRP